MFTEQLNDFFLTQVNTLPTRGNNILDLIIPSLPDGTFQNLSQWTVVCLPIMTEKYIP
jgi:hypothetical protein